MFEHVGIKNHRAFMEVAHRCLADDGVFLLHTIGKNERGGVTDPWIDKYIFPNAELPSIGHIGDAGGLDADAKKASLVALVAIRDTTKDIYVRYSTNTALRTLK
jgi:cyclopropane fatty-acyl-phospholipid synthase-like methyltransferase